MASTATAITLDAATLGRIATYIQDVRITHLATRTFDTDLSFSFMLIDLYFLFGSRDRDISHIRSIPHV